MIDLGRRRPGLVNKNINYFPFIRHTSFHPKAKLEYGSRQSYEISKQIKIDLYLTNSEIYFARVIEGPLKGDLIYRVIESQEVPSARSRK